MQCVVLSPGGLPTRQQTGDMQWPYCHNKVGVWDEQGEVKEGLPGGLPTRQQTGNVQWPYCIDKVGVFSVQCRRKLMSDVLEAKDGREEEVAALIEALRTLVDLEDGELYTPRKGQLHHVVRRDEENGLRGIKVMEEAYGAAQGLARRLRRKMRGYRPDPALVASACVMYVAEQLEPDDADDIVLAYLKRLFSRVEPAPETAP